MKPPHELVARALADIKAYRARLEVTLPHKSEWAYFDGELHRINLTTKRNPVKLRRKNADQPQG